MLVRGAADLALFHTLPSGDPGRGLQRCGSSLWHRWGVLIGARRRAAQEALTEALDVGIESLARRESWSHDPGRLAARIAVGRRVPIGCRGAFDPGRRRSGARDRPLSPGSAGWSSSSIDGHDDRPSTGRPPGGGHFNPAGSLRVCDPPGSPRDPRFGTSVACSIPTQAATQPTARRTCCSRGGWWRRRPWSASSWWTISNSARPAGGCRPSPRAGARAQGGSWMICIGLAGGIGSPAGGSGKAPYSG